MSQYQHTDWLDFTRRYGDTLQDAIIAGGVAHEEQYGTVAKPPRIDSMAAIFNPNTPAAPDEPATAAWQAMSQPMMPPLEMRQTWEPDDDDIGVMGPLDAAMDMAREQPGVPVSGAIGGVTFELTFSPNAFEEDMGAADADVVAILHDRVGLNLILPKSVIYPLLSAWDIFENTPPSVERDQAFAALELLLEVIIVALHNTFGGE